MESCGMVKQPRANPVLNLCDGIAELFGDGLAFEGLDGVRVCCGGHDDECDDGDGRAGLL